MMNQNDGSNVPTTSDPPIHPWLAMVNNGFPHSPGNPNLFNPAMMGIPPVLNPMMPPPPMWNMMNLTQDPLWINNEPPFVNPNELNETGKQSPSEPAEQRNMEEPPPSQPPVEMMMPPPPPPPPPMLRRGLSMLGGLFTNKRQPDFYSNEEFQFNQAKKEAKLAKEYAKLGTFYCWRKLDGTDAHFESFSIPNQKIIKRKLAKNAPSQIMLGKEKKLPGEIMVDLQQNRGCYLGKINGEQFLVQLEIKEETYHPSHHFVFATEGHV
ncbi:uncharacterized protein B0P05DRAFT_541947 [Gilbertella persicaria]|uniref:uncharacterized protein n=1 Tax=Gilbertella persicaria TaxID=101096 RepID=UPI00221E5644|nr:uncharacterized protein B0P05DRAFT_541947 [Gilbertella persicaria]KAI8078987.1 hypothetical protein B0P05DRAFT_541947 [Gilbertella persicaria]